MHVDIVKNEWLAGYQQCIGRIDCNCPSRPDLDAVYLGALSEKFDGSYQFITVPHEDKDCYFSDGIGARQLLIPVGEEAQGSLNFVLAVENLVKVAQQILDRDDLRPWDSHALEEALTHYDQMLEIAYTERTTKIESGSE
jgi:hypothetical protein